MEPKARATVVAWCLYDWAYSAFNTVVVTFVIATYFVEAVAVDPASGTAAWAAAQTGAGLAIALLAAPLGAVADRGGRRRAMLSVSWLLMTAGTAGLWFVRPVHQDAMLALVLVASATVAFEVGLVFYNAMLADIAPRERIGRVSGLAWGCGYLGGLVCLSLCLVIFIKPVPAHFGLDRGQAEQIRACALFAAAWILLFGWPVLVFVREPDSRTPWRLALRDGLAELLRTLRAAAANRGLLRFLIARMLYTDGLTTLFAFGAIYAAGTFGMGTSQVLLLGIALNVTAGIGALAFAFIEDYIGARPTVLTALAALIVLSTLVLLVHSVTLFWLLALGLGTFVGPAQAASRSLMAHIAPATERNAYFGLFALSGRVTGFIGPAGLGLLTAISGSQRVGMAIIVVLLAAGGALLAMRGVGAPQATPPIG